MNVERRTVSKAGPRDRQDPSEIRAGEAGAPVSRSGASPARAATVATLVGLAFLMACEGPGPTGVNSTGDPGSVADAPSGVASVPVGVAECAADLRVGSVICGLPGMPLSEVDGPSRVTLGQQGEEIVLAAGIADFNATTQVFSVPVTVQNLIGQAIGTTNGTTADPDGVRVFFSAEPWVVTGSGTVEVKNHDGTETFTDVGQKYHQYDEWLAPEEASAPKTWEFDVTGTPDIFRFRVMVQAAVQFPYGWVVVTPGELHRLASGEDTVLVAKALDVFGKEIVGAEIAWSSSDDGVATVSASGAVNAVFGGKAFVTASSGPRAPGTIDIDVIRKFEFFSEDFAGFTIDEDRWDVFDTISAVAQQDGKLEIFIPPGQARSAFLRSAEAFDLRASSIVVEISQFAWGDNNSFFETTFLVGTEDSADQEENFYLGQYVAFAGVSYWPYGASGAGRTRLTGWQQWAPSPPVPAHTFQQLMPPYALDPVNHRYQRIREQAGTIYFDTSPNGVTWTQRWSTVHQFTDPARLHVFIAVAASNLEGNESGNATSTLPGHFEGFGDAVLPAELLTGPSLVPPAPTVVETPPVVESDLVMPGSPATRFRGVPPDGSP